MTTDRELLELAAKAAGCEVNKTPAGSLFIRSGVSRWTEWNPLTDDGDALRLAVKLRLEIYHAWDEVTQVCVGYQNGERQRISYVIEEHGADIYAATRRAIVRAASEIGRNMK